MIKRLKNKQNNSVLIVCLVLVLCVLVTLSGAWFTSSKKVDGNLTRPTLVSTITLNDNESTYAYNQTFNITTSSLNTSVKLSTANVNVQNLLARVLIIVKVGTVEDDVFTQDTSIQKQILSAGPTYSSNWVAGQTLTYDGVETTLDTSTWHYYNNTLSTSSTGVEVVTDFSEYKTFLESNSSYVLQVQVVCETMVAGEACYGTDGIWNNGTEGSATASWIETIKNIVNSTT